jgi:hypothetical protein
MARALPLGALAASVWTHRTPACLIRQSLRRLGFGSSQVVLAVPGSCWGCFRHVAVVGCVSVTQGVCLYLGTPGWAGQAAPSMPGPEDRALARHKPSTGRFVSGLSPPPSAYADGSPFTYGRGLPRPPERPAWLVRMLENLRAGRYGGFLMVRALTRRPRRLARAGCGARRGCRASQGWRPERAARLQN